MLEWRGALRLRNCFLSAGKSSVMRNARTNYLWQILRYNLRSQRTAKLLPLAVGWGWGSGGGVSVLSLGSASLSHLLIHLSASVFVRIVSLESVCVRACARARTHASTHARTHTNTHIHTHTQVITRSFKGEKNTQVIDC